MNALRRIQSLPLLYAFLANAIPIYGVLFLGWDIFIMFFVFWLENVVIGISMILAIIFYGAYEAVTLWREVKKFAIAAILQALFTAAFFTFHYGMFTGGHGAMIFALFGPEGQDMNLQVEDFLVIKETITNHHLIWALIAIILAEMQNQIRTFLYKGADKTKDVGRLMFAPYKRIIVLHVGLIFGGLAAEALGQPLWALIILALLKTGFDLATGPEDRKSKKLAENS